MPFFLFDPVIPLLFYIILLAFNFILFTIRINEFKEFPITFFLLYNNELSLIIALNIYNN